MIIRAVSLIIITLAIAVAACKSTEPDASTVASARAVYVQLSNQYAMAIDTVVAMFRSGAVTDAGWQEAVRSQQTVRNAEQSLRASIDAWNQAGGGADAKPESVDVWIAVIRSEIRAVEAVANGGQ